MYPFHFTDEKTKAYRWGTLWSLSISGFPQEPWIKRPPRTLSSLGMFCTSRAVGKNVNINSHQSRPKSLWAERLGAAGFWMFCPSSSQGRPEDPWGGRGQELTKHSPVSPELPQGLGQGRAPGSCHHHSARGLVTRGYKQRLPQTSLQTSSHCHSLPVES